MTEKLEIGHWGSDMCGNEVRVSCQNRNCRSKNIYENVKAKDDIGYFACPVCKQLTVARIKGGKFSGICNYTGFLSKSPSGIIRTDGGTTIIDANGRQYTREKFKEVYGIDPMVHLLARLEQDEVFDKIDDWIKKHLI
ncbi:MAG: hypothetical protein PHS80_01640 [Methanothrix sp.]|nr:hypothetical protein [Methanothrix sp.]MDD4446232.1 hypothetical protein [Methanothrix sp.]